MKMPIVIVLAAATVSAQESSIDGSAAGIRNVVSGRTCLGDDVLTFGESARGSAGTFERSGRPAGSYNVGYGTILIRRGQDLHGHVTSVSPVDHVLYLSASTYRCAAELTVDGTRSTARTGSK
jgi:hypothetical protein